MVLKGRRDGKMRKDSFNFNFIVIISGLLYLMLFVTCEPVCYSQTSQDGLNGQIKMVDCDSDSICLRFASREDVNIGEMLNSRCAYPEEYPVTHETYAKAITCSITKLPTVSYGSFDCANKSDVPKDNACNLICKDGFYPANSTQIVCESGTSNGGGEWSNGQSLECRAITCLKANLPTVNAGFFNCSGYSAGSKCNLTCNDGYYPSSSKETICEDNTDNKANWTAGNFQCTAVACKNVDLPTVNNGSFNCSGYSVGDKCNLTCDDGFYPCPSKETVCEVYDGHKVNWTVVNYQCTAITCSTNNLPAVSDGSFNCTPDSHVPQCESCTLTCSHGFYGPFSNRAVCEAGPTNQEGVWSNGSFVCRSIECDEWNQWNGSEYKFVNTRQTWQQSSQLCVNDNSHLATIANGEENEIIRKIVDYCYIFYFENWIWVNDLKEEGTWEWSDGTGSTYTNWYEPTGGGDEGCSALHRNHGTLFDSPCDFEGHAVCEKTILLLKETAKLFRQYFQNW